MQCIFRCHYDVLCVHCRGVTNNDSVGGLLATINITCTHSVSTGGQRDFENRRAIFIPAPIGLKFCTRLLGDNTHKSGFWIFEFRTLKIWRPFEFFVCITANGTKNFKSALLEFPKLFWADIFTRTRPQAWKLILSFFAWGKFFTRLLPIFVSFTPPIIFLEPLKLAAEIFT